MKFRLFILMVVLCFAADAALALHARYVPSKPETTRFTEAVKADLIELKFIEGSGVRLRDGELISLNHTDLTEVRQFLAGYPDVTLERMFYMATEAQLTQDKRNGEARTGQELADLNLWYLCHLSETTRAQAFVDGLNALSLVEIAYPSPIPDIPSGKKGHGNLRTPDYTGQQGYLYEPPGGVNAEYAWDFEGGQGENVNWIDIEGGWQWTHEDLPDPFFEGGTQIDDLDWRNHGTAVVGEVSGIHNDYGINGIAPQAEVGCVSIGSMSTAQAIYMAYANLDEGDVFLIELHQVGGPNDTYLPMEYWQSNFDAIQTATSNGVICTEAAGNGYENLDDPVYEGLFDREVRDSGAIMCGAGTPYTLQRLNFSNYGSRLDSFGWGINVVTSGYGDLQSGSEDEWYTAQFSGTSSASPIVTGAVISLQGVMKAMSGGEVLLPLEMRQILTETGTPQANPSQYIGTRPDLERAIDGLIQMLSFFEGTVTDAADGSALRETRVYIEDSDFETFSDIDGNYRLSVAPGTYFISAERFGYYDFISEQAYTISALETLSVDIQLDARPLGTLMGHVTNTQGMPLTDAIFLPQDVPVDPFYVDSEGNYSIDLPGDVEYTLQVIAQDHDPFTFTISVPAGETTEYNIEMVYVQSFEDSDGQFSRGSGFNEWEWGTPNGGGPEFAYYGDKVWGTDLDGEYDAQTRSTLYTPAFSIGIHENPMMVMHMWYEIDEGWDGGNVAITVDNGETWEIIEPLGGYPDNSVVALGGQPGFTGSSEGWQRVEFPLTNYINQQVRFRFRFSSTNRTGWGWFLDNFTIYGATDFYVSVDDPHLAGTRVPLQYELYPNYPNPFNPKTTIRFGLPRTSDLRVTIYDVAGRLVKVLDEGEFDAGYHQLQWDGTNTHGQAVNSGVYVYRVQAGEWQETRSMVLLR